MLPYFSVSPNPPPPSAWLSSKYRPNADTSIVSSLFYKMCMAMRTHVCILQSQRWMEFSKMADNIKELSTNMLSQSRSNTRKAAIRSDLDEELEL